MRPWTVVALVGCWTDPKPVVQRPEPPQDPPPVVTVRKKPHVPTPCETAIDRAVEAFRDEIDRNQQLLERLDAVRAAAITSCTTAPWTPGTIDCFSTAADASAVKGCVSQLSTEHLRDLRDRMAEAMKTTP